MTGQDQTQPHTLCYPKVASPSRRLLTASRSTWPALALLEAPDVDDGKRGRGRRRVCLFCVNRPFVNRRTRGRCLVPERLFENVLDLALDAALEKALFELVGVRGGERELFVRARFTREE